MGAALILLTIVLAGVGIWVFQVMSANTERHVQKRARAVQRARLEESPDYELIRKFVQRGADRGTLDADDIERLAEALPEEYGLDVESVREIVLQELCARSVGALRAAILSRTPTTLTELLDAFIEVTRSGRNRRERESAAFFASFKGNLETLDDVGEMISRMGEVASPHSAEQRCEFELLRDLIVELGFRKECDLPTAATLECDRRLSLEKKEYRSALLSYQPDRQAANLDELSGTEFELYLCQLFERMGYEVRTTPTTGDQGADLVLLKGGVKTVVQAKRYKGNVGNSAVQEVVAARHHYGADEAMVVTTGTFTRAAQELASSNAVVLVDGAALSRFDYGG